MKKNSLIAIIGWIGILVNSPVFGQSQPTEGTISFVTSQNIYVKIDGASKVSIDDTLYLSDQKTPLLIVTAKSSLSLVCEALSGVSISKGQKVLYFHMVQEVTTEETDEQPIEQKEEKDTPEKKKVNLRDQQRVSGRLSAASYSTFGANNNSSTHRIMERARLDIDHIQGSDFSFESYLYINQIFQQGLQTTSDNRVRVYNLALIYDNPKLFKASVGRSINRNMSSIGPVDGLQLEKSFGKVSVGAIAGFKPDLYDFGLNTDQGQLGAFTAISLGNRKTIQTTSTIGIIDQRNRGNIDRQYTYLQHQSTLFRKLSLFVSSELDLYNGNIDSLKTGARLTNLFASARYRLNSALSFMVSYDQRKRVIYYEYYQLDIERLLQNDYVTTGWRTRINYRLNKNIFLGLNYNSRNRDQANFASMGGNVTINKLPFVPGSVSVYYNRNDGRSVSSESASATYRNNFFQKKLRTYTYYRLVRYTSIGFEGQLTAHHYFGSKVNYRLNDKLSLGVLGEYSFNEFDQNYRVNLQVIKRFGN